MWKVALADTLKEWDSILAHMDEHPELQTPQFRELRDALAATAEMTRLLVQKQERLWPHSPAGPNASNGSGQADAGTTMKE